MSMIRSIPGGLKHRDLPDPSYKGKLRFFVFFVNKKENSISIRVDEPLTL